MSTPRIALFAPYFPAPAFSGGRIRIQHFAQALARDAELHLFARAPERRAGDPATLASAHGYRALHLARGWPTCSLRSTTPARVRNAAARGLQRAFLRAHAARPFDAVVVEHAHAAYAALHAGVPWVLDEHNIESEYCAALQQAARGSHAPRPRPSAALQAWELRCWRAADAIVTVTERDAQRVAERAERDTTHIANGVDTRALAFRPPDARRGTDVLFVGLLDHPPNVRAALWLAQQVMPRVWPRVPVARLVLCGANPARAVRALEQPRVVVTGRVPEVGPYFATAAVFANGLGHGAGSSLKVLEALASGLPLVSTEVGVRGFRLRPGEHYRNAETPAEFADEIVHCLQGRERDGWAQIAARGRAFAEDHDWPALAKRFAALVMRVAATARARS